VFSHYSLNMTLLILSFGILPLNDETLGLPAYNSMVATLVLDFLYVQNANDS